MRMYSQQTISLLSTAIKWNVCATFTNNEQPQKPSCKLTSEQPELWRSQSFNTGCRDVQNSPHFQPCFSLPCFFYTRKRVVPKGWLNFVAARKNQVLSRFIDSTWILLYALLDRGHLNSYLSVCVPLCASVWVFEWRVPFSPRTLKLDQFLPHYTTCLSLSSNLFFSFHTQTVS